MITIADALEVMTTIVAVHPRTAPRMDDEEATLATATVWTDILAEFDFDVRELVEAVKFRGKGCPDAPELADVIRVARNARSERMARTVAPSADREDPGDAKAAPDPAEYPTHWTPAQRTTAYWFALRMNAMPRTTAGWEGIAKQLEQARADHPVALPAAKAEPLPSEVAAKIAAARQALDAEQEKS